MSEGRIGKGRKMSLSKSATCFPHITERATGRESVTQSIIFSGLDLADEPGVLEGLEGDGQVDILCSTCKDVIPAIPSN